VSEGRPIEQRLAEVGLPPLPRLAWIEVDQDALADNVRVVRDLVGPRVAVAAVVKADGYGHGLRVAARSFLAGGADLLCTATLDEALDLRAAGITAPIVVLFRIPASEVVTAVEAGIELVAADGDGLRETLAAWRAAGAGRQGRMRLHLEVETGLGRAGLPPGALADAARAIRATPGASAASLWSHLARADDAASSTLQAERLDRAATVLRDEGLHVPQRHLAATGGLFAATAPALELVRPGLALYGELPDDLPVADPALEAASRLRPAIALKARPLRVIEVDEETPVGYGGRWLAPRRSRVATLPVGYGDGWTRVAWQGTAALVHGRRVPLVGTVAMDAVAADVTDVPGAGPYDEFVLLGAQGRERITVAELARARNTISWEVLTSMAYRVPRVYHAATGPRGLRTLAGERSVGDDVPAPSGSSGSGQPSRGRTTRSPPRHPATGRGKRAQMRAVVQRRSDGGPGDIR
jgi:alanine racemase